MTQDPKLRAIPYPQPTLTSIHEAVLALKVNVEQLAGMRGHDIGRSIRHEEFHDAIDPILRELISLQSEIDGIVISPPMAAASTTEVLNGVETNKAVTPDALAALWEKGADVASAATISLGEGGYFVITGTATITDIDFATPKNGRYAWLRFADVLTLTHNATTLVLPSGANITTAAGDHALVVQDNSDNVYVAGYIRADGRALTAPVVASTTDVLTGTDAVKPATSDALAALWEKGADVASAATISLGEGGYFVITGTATITDIDFATPKNGRYAWLRFADVLTLTHNATTLVLPSGANITTAAGDHALVVQDNSDNVYVAGYIRADGRALTAPVVASTTDVLTGTDAVKPATSDALAALWEKGSNVASAGTVALGEGGFFHITGTTTITDIDFATAKDGRFAWVIFDGALTLTHNATTLILPGGADITTAANDRALFIQDASDNVICLVYVPAAGVSSAWQTILAQTTPTGTYTPTLTNTTNLDASTAYTTPYVRIGDRVIVSITWDANATAAAGTGTVMGVSLPIASNFIATGDCQGAGAMNTAAGSAAYTGVIVGADAANNRATFTWRSGSTANTNGAGIFMYQVL